MTAILTPMLYALGSAGVLLVMAVVFAESGLLLGFFLPGDSLLFLAGALVATHVISVPLWLVMSSVFIAAALGDQVGFLIGRRFGPRLLERPDGRFFRSAYVDRTRAFFDRHGSIAVVLARFVPIVRTFTPAVAGAVGMPRARFTAYNLIGAAVWGAGWVGVGYLFGGIPFVAAHVEALTLAIAGSSVVPAAVALLRRRRSVPPAPTEQPTDWSSTGSPKGVVIEHQFD